MVFVPLESSTIVSIVCSMTMTCVIFDTFQALICWGGDVSRWGEGSSVRPSLCGGVVRSAALGP